MCKYNFRLSIVMPVLNNIELTKRAIETLDLHSFTPKGLMELIIIDDGSTEETKQELEMIANMRNKNGKKTHLITNPERLGVTKSWNIGIKKATGEFIAICNNDILFGSNWDLFLMEVITSVYWVTSPYHTTKTEELSDWPLGQARHDNGGFPLLGACFMARKSTFDTIGAFDERVKIWCNDNWLVDVITQKYKKSIKMVRRSYVHHFYSKTCNEGAISGFTKEAQQDQKTYAKIRHEFIN